MTKFLFRNVSAFAVRSHHPYLTLSLGWHGTNRIVSILGVLPKVAKESRGIQPLSLLLGLSQHFRKIYFANVNTAKHKPIIAHLHHQGFFAEMLVLLSVITPLLIDFVTLGGMAQIGLFLFEVCYPR
jgi:hypothetical protein